MAKLRVWFAWTANVGVTWYRFINPGTVMRKIPGVEVAWSKWSPYDNVIIKWEYEIYDPITKQENPAVREQLDRLSRCADIIVCGTFTAVQGLGWFAASQEIHKKPYLLEVDDYILNPPEYNAAVGGYRQGGLGEYLTVKQLKIADGIIASTPYLKKLYSQFNSNIEVVPNGQNFEIWDNLKKKPRENDKIRIGFAGSPNHVGDLRLVRDPLLQVLKDNPNVELILAGPEPEFFKNHPQISFVENWVPITEYPQMLSDLNIDIGIAPLKDNNLNRSKSAIRWQEYSCVKAATVATKIEAFKDSIEDGKTGFLADNESEWYEKLTVLVKNADLRKSIGMKAYNKVKADWNIKTIAKHYVKVLQKFKKEYKKKKE